MQQYVVAKSFIVGEINHQLRTSQTVFFDGSTLMIGENKYTAPGVSSAIRMGWLLAVDSPRDNSPVAQITPSSVSKTESRLNTQVLLDQYKVVDSSASQSSLPPKQPRPLIDFGTKVISDADEDNVSLEEAMPSVKMKRDARKSLKKSEDTLDKIPDISVLSDGGPETKLQRTAKPVKKNILDSLPLVDTRNSVPVVPPPNKVFGGTVFDPDEAAATKTEGLEVLSIPKTESTDTSVKKAKRKTVPQDDHMVLAQSVGAEPLAHPIGSSIPDNWKSLSFRDRKAFVEGTDSVDTLKTLLLLEKGAVKKFITSKLETISNA